MAHMSQERKAGIAAELKAIIPKSWKYSLSVHHHSTLVLTISKSPVDFIGATNTASKITAEQTGREPHLWDKSVDVNVYHWRDQLRHLPSDAFKLFERIMDALYRGNHDNSDIQSDYFDVGWYVDVRIGKWDKPYEQVGNLGESLAPMEPIKLGGPVRERALEEAANDEPIFSRTFTRKLSGAEAEQAMEGAVEIKVPDYSAPGISNPTIDALVAAGHIEPKPEQLISGKHWEQACKELFHASGQGLHMLRERAAELAAGSDRLHRKTYKVRSEKYDVHIIVEAAGRDEAITAAMMRGGSAFEEEVTVERIG